MENEQYTPDEMLSSKPATEEQLSGTETVEQQSSERSRFHYRFDELIGDATDELEKALARFQGEQKNIKRMDLLDIMSLNIATYKIRLELLMRNNPEMRKLHDTLRANGLRIIEAQKQWEKEILATEGEEGLKRRKQNGKGPINQTNHEELDMNVRSVQLQVEAGILKPFDLTHAIEVRDAGGYYQWEKEFSRKNAENNIRELVAANDPDIATVIQNIYRYTEDNYGRDYAEKQKSELSELAGIASPKEPPTRSGNTAD